MELLLLVTEPGYPSVSSVKPDDTANLHVLFIVF